MSTLPKPTPLRVNTDLYIVLPTRNKINRPKTKYQNVGSCANLLQTIYYFSLDFIKNIIICHCCIKIIFGHYVKFCTKFGRPRPSGPWIELSNSGLLKFQLKLLLQKIISILQMSIFLDIFLHSIIFSK